MRKQPTGEPVAGKPHTGFGGRGRRKPFPTPIQRNIHRTALRDILARPALKSSLAAGGISRPRSIKNSGKPHKQAGRWESNRRPVSGGVRYCTAHHGHLTGPAEVRSQVLVLRSWPCVRVFVAPDYHHARRSGRWGARRSGIKGENVAIGHNGGQPRSRVRRRPGQGSIGPTF